VSRIGTIEDSFKPAAGNQWFRLSAFAASC
jgi:hypothetical protein